MPRLCQRRREWQPKGQPEQVQVHDFPDPKLGKAIPDGVYDVAANTGWVSVGVDHDTDCFAVATVRRWWEHVGRTAYPNAPRLLICADGGGPTAPAPGCGRRSSPARRIRTASSARCAGDPSGTDRSPATTSSGPRTRNPSARESTRAGGGSATSRASQLICQLRSNSRPMIPLSSGSLRRHPPDHAVPYECAAYAEYAGV
jgi:DDE family transposase